MSHPFNDEGSPVPPPTADGTGVPPPPMDAAGTGGDVTLDRHKGSFWRRLGGVGLGISVGIHLFLFLLFAFWVVSSWTDTSKKDPDTFATGAGGGAAGDAAKIYEHKVQPKNARNLAKNSSRILSRNANAAVSLPDLPVTSVSSMINGMTAGGSSKGWGGGSGGGIGSGKGVGVGNGRNFVGRPVMGAKIYASRIAVYEDASGSMRGYLDRVEAEIRKQFPEADIYRYNGGWTFVEGGDVVGGRRSRGKEGVGPPQDPSSFSTDPKSLTADGKSVFRKYDDNFRKGSLGAWLDVMQHEKYDALVIFSDFQDGVDQYDKKGNLIYADGLRQQVNNRKKADERWEQDWLTVFGRGRDGGVKLYCFSTEQQPQPLLSACVKASGGEIKMVTWLAGHGAPPPADPNDPSAGKTVIQSTQQPYHPAR